jgi:hypothetical protein
MTIPFVHKIIEMPAFDSLGYTKIVKSGGELYKETRDDGRWTVLRQIAGSDQSIYGVASFDRKFPKDHYRYTLAVRNEPDTRADRLINAQLFAFHVKQSR